MGNVVTHPPSDQESLFAQLRQDASGIDWNQVRAILRTHGRHAAQWKDTKNDGQGPLHYACWHNGPLDVVQTLVTLWPDAVKEKDNYGNLPLHYACENNQSREVIQLLIDKCPDTVQERDDNGYLPLHYACRYNQSLGVIKLLVNKYPFAVKEKDDNGYLPLHYACRNSQSLEGIQCLVKQWPDAVKEKDKVWQLPLHLACGNNQSLKVIQWLVWQWPESIQERNRHEKTPLDFARHPWFGKGSNQATVRWLEIVVKGGITFPAASSSLPTVAMLTTTTSPVPPAPPSATLARDRMAARDDLATTVWTQNDSEDLARKDPLTLKERRRMMDLPGTTRTRSSSLLAEESNDDVLEFVTQLPIEGAKDSRLENLRAEVAELRETVQRQERTTTWVETLRIDLGSLGESLHVVSRPYDFSTKNGPVSEPVIADTEWKLVSRNKKTQPPNTSYAKAAQKTPNEKMNQAQLEGDKNSSFESLRAEVAELREAVQRQERETTRVEALRIDLAYVGESLHSVTRQYDVFTENGPPHQDTEPSIASLPDSEWKVAQNKKKQPPNTSYATKSLRGSYPPGL